MKRSLQFPEQLKIRVSEVGSRLPLDGIAMKITLFAPKKNDYHYPIVTRENGIAIVLKENVQQYIEDTQNLFLMDYASSFEECNPVIQIKILSAEQVQRSISAMETFKKVSNFEEHLIEGYKNSQNNLFNPQIVNVRLTRPCSEKIIDIHLERNNS